MAIVPAFLEERNREFSEKLGVTAPRLLITPADQESSTYDPSVLNLRPEFISALDQDEATFMIASTLITTRAMFEMQRRVVKLPSRRQLRIRFFLYVILGPPVMAVPMYIGFSELTPWWWVPLVPFAIPDVDNSVSRQVKGVLTMDVAELSRSQPALESQLQSSCNAHWLPVTQASATCGSHAD